MLIYTPLKSLSLWAGDVEANATYSYQPRMYCSFSTQIKLAVLGQQILQECYWEHNVCHFWKYACFMIFFFSQQFISLNKKIYETYFLEVEDRLCVPITDKFANSSQPSLSLGGTNVT